MNLDLTSLFPDLEALTPDGRWNALQSWLKENPEYGKRVDKWAKQTVDQVYGEIERLANQKYGPLAATIMATTKIDIKIKRWIELLQTCYQERQAYDNQPLEKETKNVRHKRTGRKNSKQV